MFYAYGVSTRSLRAELQLCDQSTLHWKEFLAATMDKNLALREDKIRLAFDHFRHAQSSNTTTTTTTTNGNFQELLDTPPNGGGEGGGEFSTTSSSEPEQSHNYLAVQDLIELFGGESQAKEIMGFVDVDGDGRISFEEFRNAIQESMIINDVSGYDNSNSNDNTPPTSHHHHPTNPPREND
mmetsp:Transcript_16051/g.22360  ORF Transcript_16051/g.22360 Transcript_16051/m.22360 type:complete len:182 (+) Transcript_16051:1007-1552(+)